MMPEEEPRRCPECGHESAGHSLVHCHSNLDFAGCPCNMSICETALKWADKLAAADKRIGELLRGMPERDAQMFRERDGRIAELEQQLAHLRAQAGPDSCADLVARNRGLEQQLAEVREVGYEMLVALLNGPLLTPEQRHAAAVRMGRWG